MCRRLRMWSRPRRSALPRSAPSGKRSSRGDLAPPQNFVLVWAAEEARGFAQERAPSGDRIQKAEVTDRLHPDDMHMLFKLPGRLRMREQAEAECSPQERVDRRAFRRKVILFPSTCLCLLTHGDLLSFSATVGVGQHELWSRLGSYQSTFYGMTF